jgi:hypothetical protein
MWLRHSGQHTFKCVVFLNDTFSVASSPEGRDGCIFFFGHDGGAVGLGLVQCCGTEDGEPKVNITGSGRQEERLRAPEA